MKALSEIKKNIRRKLLEAINESLIKGNSAHAMDLGRLLDKKGTKIILKKEKVL